LRRNRFPHDVGFDHRNRRLVKPAGETQQVWPAVTVSVRQVGRPPLMATSRTPKVRPTHAARWFRDRVRAHLVSGTLAGADRHRPKATGVGLALVVLVGLTTLVVAWVSVWWVPAYLALMALIFITPQGRSRPARESKPGEESADSVLTDLDDGLRVDRADERAHHHLTVESILGSIAGESTTETADFNSDSISAGTAKPRRGRGRVRRATKTAAEPMLESAAVTWIRVGPGKFVRADANSQAVDQAQTEEVTVEADPAADVSAQEWLAPLVSAAALVEQDLSNPPETISGEEAKVTVSDHCMLGSIVEVHGITPSAFSSSVPPDSLSVEGLEEDGFDVVVTPKAETSTLASLDGNAARDAEDRGQLDSQGGTSGSRVCRVLRGIASAIPRGDRASLRRNIRRRPKTRTLIWSSDPPNARIRQAARRAFGRLPHVQRALRPRSPPYR
jgi:hypothetical protein